MVVLYKAVRKDLPEDLIFKVRSHGRSGTSGSSIPGTGHSKCKVPRQEHDWTGSQIGWCQYETSEQRKGQTMQGLTCHSKDY